MEPFRKTKGKPWSECDPMGMLPLESREESCRNSLTHDGSSSHYCAVLDCFQRGNAAESWMFSGHSAAEKQEKTLVLSQHRVAEKWSSLCLKKRRCMISFFLFLKFSLRTSFSSGASHNTLMKSLILAQSERWRCA